MNEGKDQRWIVLAVFALVAVGVVGAILLARNSGGDEDDQAKSGAAGCKQVDKPAAKKVSLKAPPQTVKRGETISAVVAHDLRRFHDRAGHRARAENGQLVRLSLRRRPL